MTFRKQTRSARMSRTTPHPAHLSTRSSSTNLTLPPLRAHALSSFAYSLVENAASGLWYDLRHADERHLFDDVIYTLVPAHVTSPRRVKVLLQLRHHARVAQARGILAAELAVLTVLQTEFPPVASALVQFPQLLNYLRKPVSDVEPSDPTLTIRRMELLTNFRYDADDTLSEATESGATGDSVSGVLLRTAQSTTAAGRIPWTRQAPG